mmetsp:Transcript_10122/g.17623  ORF Transcript_10122/g.17623 Transcript_10122/m.17623 type:complete len:235 (+) Transcript_10122:921-1625(+)
MNKRGSQPVRSTGSYPGGLGPSNGAARRMGPSLQSERRSSAFFCAFCSSLHVPSTWSKARSRRWSMPMEVPRGARLPIPRRTCPSSSSENKGCPRALRCPLRPPTIRPTPGTSASRPMRRRNQKPASPPTILPMLAIVSPCCRTWDAELVCTLLVGVLVNVASEVLMTIAPPAPGSSPTFLNKASCMMAFDSKRVASKPRTVSMSSCMARGTQSMNSSLYSCQKSPPYVRNRYA